MRRIRSTIEKKTLKSFSDGELRVEDDKSEGDGEGVVAGVAPEKITDCRDADIMGLVGGVEGLGPRAPAA